MITLYHGTTSKIIIPGVPSRYGFPAMFYTNNMKLAHNYAKYWSEKNELPALVRKRTIEPEQIDKIVDFELKVTHAGGFRNLILSLRGHKIVRIKNCLDRPSEKYPLVMGDIFVFFE
jgi:hypothetical protein